MTDDYLNNRSIIEQATLMALLGPAWETVPTLEADQDGVWIEVNIQQRSPSQFYNKVNDSVHKNSDVIAERVDKTVTDWINNASDEELMEAFGYIRTQVLNSLNEKRYGGASKFDYILSRQIQAVSERVVEEAVKKKLAEVDMDKLVEAKINGLDLSEAKIEVKLPGTSVEPV